VEYVDRTIPAYGFYAPCRPTYNSPKGKEEYQKAIAEAARKEIERPIEADDIEVEILYVTTEPEKSLDVDNVGKPTLDALKGIAYIDDRQVRAIRIVRFDKTKPHRISGRIGPIKAIYESADPHNVWIWIYSYSRSKELKFPRPKGWEIHVLMKPVGKEWD
jgi:Holliday junction resolvase RusA-like endonuclease